MQRIPEEPEWEEDRAALQGRINTLNANIAKVQNQTTEAQNLIMQKWSAYYRKIEVEDMRRNISQAEKDLKQYQEDKKTFTDEMASIVEQ
jgi:hypothetical protein